MSYQISYKATPIHYTVRGSGPAVVLLHGFLESAAMWQGFEDVWAATRQVITIDLLGHGTSGCIGYVHSMEEMAEAVVAVLDKEAVDRALLVGHSMGGYVALALAEKYPKRLTGLILLNSTSEADSAARKANRTRALKLLKSHPQAYISMAIGNLFAPDSLARFQPQIEAIKTEALTFPVQGLIAATEGMKARKDRTAVLSKLSVPKHIIAGVDDPVIPVEDLGQLAQKTGSTLHQLTGGHMSTVENKEGVLEVMEGIVGTDVK